MQYSGTTWLGRFLTFSVSGLPKVCETVGKEHYNLKLGLTADQHNIGTVNFCFFSRIIKKQSVAFAYSSPFTIAADNQPGWRSPMQKSFESTA